MPLHLTLDIELPLTKDESEALMGISVMTHAIGSRGVPDETEPTEEPVLPEQAEKTSPCPAVEGDLVCINQSGHRGRHKFRALVAGMN